MAGEYSDDYRISWYRSPIDKGQLSQLMKRSNLRGWLQTVGHLGLFCTTGVLAYLAYLNVSLSNWPWSLPLLLATLFAHGTMGPFTGLIAIHELQHRTVFESKALNEFFEKVYAFISWSDYLWYQHSHVRHHQATCHRAHDGEVALPQTFSIRRWEFWLSMLAWNPRATWRKLKQVWRHARGHIDGDWYEHVLPESAPAARRAHQNWARTLLIGHTLIALTFVISGFWFGIVVFTFGTFYCGWLGFACGMPQHYGLNPDVPDFRMSTRTFTCSRLVGFYYWNMQYHLEHHMYPGVPFYNLPRLRQAIASDLPPATHGLVATWREILAIRDQSIKDRQFQFKPAIPGRS